MSFCFAPSIFGFFSRFLHILIILVFFLFFFCYCCFWFFFHFYKAQMFGVCLGTVVYSLSPNKLSHGSTLHLSDVRL